MNNLRIHFFDEIYDFIEQLPKKDRAIVMAHITTMKTDMSVVYTKTLKSPIRELIVKKYRLLFFIEKNTIYFTTGFVKKSQKTPIQEIRKAESIYKAFK